MTIKRETTIFSTGVLLQAVKCIINGKSQWRWVAERFEDESFLDGKAVNPFEYADDHDSLIEKFQDE